MEAIDRHNYFGGGAGGHNITTGSVNNATHMNKAGRGILSSGLWQVEDKPFIMTEWTQKPPEPMEGRDCPPDCLLRSGIARLGCLLSLRWLALLYG